MQLLREALQSVTPYNENTLYIILIGYRSDPLKELLYF